MQPNTQTPQQQPAQPQQSAGQFAAPAPQAPAQAPAGSGQPQQQPQGNPNSTQSTLLISEIRDNIVIMKDGSFRAIVTCESINFDLMSEREREGVEYSYQNFLNSLRFPVQILIRSQRVDIGPYLDRLSSIRSSQDNMLLNVLMDDYINFIYELSQEANIMDKGFYIIIPYNPVGDLTNVKEQAKGFFGKILAKPSTGPTRIDGATYQKAKDELRNRVELVTSGLYQMGVQSKALNTKQLGELYYNVYNPDTAVREPLGNFQDVTSTFVRKGGQQQPTPEGQQQ